MPFSKKPSLKRLVYAMVCVMVCAHRFYSSDIMFLSDGNCKKCQFDYLSCHNLSSSIVNIVGLGDTVLTGKTKRFNLGQPLDSEDELLYHIYTVWAQKANNLNSTKAPASVQIII